MFVFRVHINKYIKPNDVYVIEIFTHPWKIREAIHWTFRLYVCGCTIMYNRWAIVWVELNAWNGHIFSEKAVESPLTLCIFIFRSKCHMPWIKYNAITFHFHCSHSDADCLVLKIQVLALFFSLSIASSIQLDCLYPYRSFSAFTSASYLCVIVPNSHLLLLLLLLLLLFFDGLVFTRFSTFSKHALVPRI